MGTSLELVARLDEWFAKRLADVKCCDETRAYIVSVLNKYKGAGEDMSTASIVLSYYDARQRDDFESYQRVGDWVLWASSLCPEHLDPNADVAVTMARLSYYTCYRKLRCQWHVYEELADEFPALVARVRRNLTLDDTREPLAVIYTPARK